MSRGWVNSDFKTFFNCLNFTHVPAAESKLENQNKNKQTHYIPGAARIFRIDGFQISLKSLLSTISSHKNSKLCNFCSKWPKIDRFENPPIEIDRFGGTPQTCTNAAPAFSKIHATRGQWKTFYLKILYTKQISDSLYLFYITLAFIIL